MNNIIKIIVVLAVLAVLSLGANYFYQKNAQNVGGNLVATAPTPEVSEEKPAPVDAAPVAPAAPAIDASNANAPATISAAPTDATKGIDAAIEAYIKAHPEVIINAVSQYQQDQAHKQIEQSEKIIAAKWNDLINVPSDPTLGNPKGDVTIVEFFDYSCSYCRHVLPYIVKILETDPNVKVIFKEFPILSNNSELAARAALAVNQINASKYLDFHKALFSGKAITQASILETATAVGLDANVVKEKMTSAEVETILTNNRQFAFEAGIRGTPAFIINGKLIPGVADLETLQGLIKEARAKK